MSGDALEGHLVEDRIELDAALDQRLVGTTAEAVHPGQDVRDVVLDALLVEEGPVGAEITPVADRADHDDAVAPRCRGPA
jgi:hypothetical protein